MTHMIRIGALLAALFAATAGHAQPAPGPTGYPSKQVRVIVPYPPGGPTDVIARLVAQKLTDALGQSFYVENVTGASGQIGAGAAANAPPDGATLLFVTNDFAVAPATSSKLPYNPEKNFVAVSIVASSPQVVFVHPSLPVKTMQELKALLKKEPGKYSYGAIGLGFGQLTGEWLFRRGLDVEAIRVPFQGAAPVMTSILGNHTPIAMLGLPPATPSIKEGTVRALAVTSPKRSPVFPDVPTMDESGFTGQQSELQIGLVAPAGTPTAVVDLLQTQVAKIVTQPDVKSRLDALGFIGVASKPEVYAKQIKDDLTTWSKVVKELNIQVD